ncbi:cytochrome c maturation protein CcmE [Microvirga tunisiensis]|uniref:Cytochrome c-type biogenesis protein CcmE n=2 Tax=Pannonibacter tanglangensis TaxID=2750084 RepID=A0A7X5J932_9HYPH|nr:MULTISPECIES: cytochrome c maturation protein CcmE [unclassified Pannonibacter]NBN62873.1 cytochrome c maturation protein CcmE [Pannonibacter sp. XCT-34]NBN78447.1 cytochrome c maturation protein CcmE [Pannonibacter sp. XCT-53]
MTRKQRRLTLIGSAAVVLASAVGLVLYALNDQIVFFRTPTDVMTQQIPAGQRIRLGGLVETGSVVRSDDARVSFRVTDTANAVPVTYVGILPDLFREGQGVVTEGIVGPDGVFKADNVLAKHDENYVPKEVADALKAQGVWKGDGAPPQ